MTYRSRKFASQYRLTSFFTAPFSGCIAFHALWVVWLHCCFRAFGLAVVLLECFSSRHWCSIVSYFLSQPFLLSTVSLPFSPWQGLPEDIWFYVLVLSFLYCLSLLECANSMRQGILFSPPTQLFSHCGYSAAICGLNEMLSFIQHESQICKLLKDLPSSNTSFKIWNYRRDRDYSG